MEIKRVRSLTGPLALLAGLLLALSPTIAQAQSSFFSVVVYEVREDIQCHPGGTPALPDCSDLSAQGFGTRIAQATLTGTASGQVSGGITFNASSVISQVDWIGPAHGSFIANTAQGAVSGRLGGELNLSLALPLRPTSLPLAPISGRWTSTGRTAHAGGSFTGMFVIPFPCALPGTGFCYLAIDPATGQPGVDPATGFPVVAVQPNELNSLGVPLVKAFVNFFND